MKIYSAAITVEFQAEDDKDAERRQGELAALVKDEPDVVYTDTIGPPTCIDCPDPDDYLDEPTVK